MSVRQRAQRSWVASVDSHRWRRLSKTSTGARIMGSRQYAVANMARRYASTRYKCVRDPARFAQVETFCVFIGHVKSGGTLIGSLLDAHPDAIVSDEIDVLRYLDARFSRDQIFHLLEKGSRREAMKGRVTARRLDPYSFAVPGLSQGHSDTVRVIGDVRAGPTTRRTGGRVDALLALESVVAPASTRYLHVVRDPFDPISAMVRRGKRTLANAIEDYSQQCDRLVSLRSELDPSRVRTVRYETFTRSPAEELAVVCEFVGLSTDSDYLERCAHIIEPDRPGERTTVEWDDESIESVGRVIAEVPFLQGYQW